MNNFKLTDIANLAAAGDTRLRPDQANALIREIVVVTRSVLARDMRAVHPDLPEDKLLDAHTLIGWCGFSQCITAYGLDEIGIRNKPFAVQTLPCYDQGHVALVVPLHTTQGQKHYLIDPTYIQFEDEYDVENSTIRTLMDDGYIELTPQVADDYIRSLSMGRGCETKEEALLSIVNAPASKHNYWFRTDEIGQRVASFRSAFAPA